MKSVLVGLDAFFCRRAKRIVKRSKAVQSNKTVAFFELFSNFKLGVAS